MIECTSFAWYLHPPKFTVLVRPHTQADQSTRFVKYHNMVQ
jgi:hypothetical protein